MKRSNYPSLITGSLTFEDLEGLAREKGVAVGFADIPFGLFIPSVLGVPVILLPQEATRLERTWTMAHKMGHVILTLPTIPLPAQIPRKRCGCS